MLCKEVLPREFYTREPKTVAIGLLGKILVRALDGRYLKGVIVETEAYYGEDDPASRARGGIRKYNAPMWGEPGRALIYNVHGNWLLNIVAHEPNHVGAVLIRALEPLSGIEIMMANRKAQNIRDLTNGPGRLTRALTIDRSMNNIDLTDGESPIFIVNEKPIAPRRIGCSHRIGVSADLNEKLRFFIKDNPFVLKTEKSH